MNCGCIKNSERSTRIPKLHCLECPFQKVSHTSAIASLWLMEVLGCQRLSLFSLALAMQSFVLPLSLVLSTKGEYIANKCKFFSQCEDSALKQLESYLSSFLLKRLFVTMPLYQELRLLSFLILIFKGSSSRISKNTWVDLMVCKS